MSHPELPFPTPASHVGAMYMGDDLYQGDPERLFRDLRREHGAVAPVLLPWGVPAWLVLGYSELLQVTTSPEVFGRSHHRWRLLNLLPPEWPLWPQIGGGLATEGIMYAEGEDHRRRTNALNDGLARMDPWEFQERCRLLSEQLIETFPSAGEVDLMMAYAQRLPVLAVSGVAGVPEDQQEELLSAFLQLMNVTPGDPLEGMQKADDLCMELAERSLRSPGSDLASFLAHSGLELPQRQLAGDLFVMMIAGHQTCVNWIGNTMRLMLTDQAHTDAFTRGRRSVTEASREVLKDDTPTQIYAGRYTTRATQLGGTEIPSGDLVLLGLAAAHSDPLFRPPGETRDHHSRAYLSFSHGSHGCPHMARSLAETITVTGIETLLTRLPDLHLAVPADELRWQPQVMMRGLERLPVRYTPLTQTPDPLGESLWL